MFVLVVQLIDATRSRAGLGFSGNRLFRLLGAPSDTPEFLAKLDRASATNLKLRDDDREYKIGTNSDKANGITCYHLICPSDRALGIVAVIAVNSEGKIIRY